MSLTPKLTALIPTVFEPYLMSLATGESFLEAAGMVGTGKASPVRLSVQLSARKGSKVTFPLVRSLKNAGVKSNAGTTRAAFTIGDGGTTAANQALTGSEEEITYSVSEATVNVYRHAVKLDGELTEQQMARQIMEDAVPLLEQWVNDKKDYLAFAAMWGPPATGGEYDTTTNGFRNALNCQVTLSGETVGWGNVGTAMRMTIDRIKRISYFAKLRGIPAVRMQGVGKVRGVLIISPGQEADLKEDPDWEISQRQARPRGSDNPLFTGAIGEIDNIFIHVAEANGDASGAVNACYLYQDTSPATYDKVEAVFLGAGAIGYARKYDMKMIQGDVTDYGDQPSIGVKFFGGFVKTTINNGTTSSEMVRDYATIYVPTAAQKAA